MEDISDDPQTMADTPLSSVLSTWIWRERANSNHAINFAPCSWHEEKDKFCGIKIFVICDFFLLCSFNVQAVAEYCSLFILCFIEIYNYTVPTCTIHKGPFKLISQDLGDGLSQSTEILFQQIFQHQALINNRIKQVKKGVCMCVCTP